MSLFSRLFKKPTTSQKRIASPACKNHVIEFFLCENDLPLEIQLEPECLIFKVEPGNDLKFVATTDDDDFKWSLNISRKENGIQLFPEGKGNSDINIYENNNLLEDWFKYMR